MTVKRLRIFLVCCVLAYCFVQETSLYAQGANTSEISVSHKRINDPEIREESIALAHFIMGMIYDNYGRTPKAITEYEFALKVKDDVSDVYVRLSTDYLLLGKVEESIKNIKKSLELEPKNIKARIVLAIIYTSTGKFFEAKKTYEEALEYDPENISVLTFLSDLYINQKELNKAAEIYEKIIDIRKDNAYAYYNLGLIYGRLNLLDKAASNISKALEVDEKYIDAQMILGTIYEIENKDIEAIDEYRKVLEIDALNLEARRRLVQIYNKLGEKKQALIENEEIITLYPNMAEAYLRGFSIHVTSKETTAAREILERAIGAGVEDSMVYASMGYLEGLHGNYEETIEYYKKALEIEDENNLYKYYLAIAYDRIGKQDITEDLLNEILDSGEEMAEAYNYLGYMYLEKDKKIEKAVQYIEKAIELEPENGAYLDSLAWAYYKKGNLDEAFEAITKAVEVLPSNSIIRDHLADILYKQGHLEKAISEWGKALELDEGNEAIKTKINKVTNILKKQSK